MGYRDPAAGRARDRERFRKRVEKRRAAGLCPRCGERPPAPGRSVCEPCAENRRVAGRARDARLRAAGKPRRNLAKARASERERARRQTAERRAAGLCTRCGQAQAVPGRAVCESCGDRSREAERIGYAKARADGKLYGGRDPGAKRRSACAASRKRQHVRCDAGKCLRCGKRPPAEGGTTCEPCREARQAAETRPLCPTSRQRPLRQVRRADLRRRLPLRALRHPRRPAPGAQERRGQKTLRRPPGCRALYRLRSPFAGRREVSGLRRTLLPPLRSLPRHPGLASAVHRDRTRHGNLSRHLRQRGRGRRLPRLREAVPGPGRDRPGYQPDGPVDRLDLNGDGGDTLP